MVKNQYELVYCFKCNKKMQYLNPIFSGMKLIGENYICENGHVEPKYFRKKHWEKIPYF